MSTPDLHTPEAHDVIACELVACTLGQRRRPELRVDVVGMLARITAAYTAAQVHIGGRLVEALRPMVAHLAEARRKGWLE